MSLGSIVFCSVDYAIDDNPAKDTLTPSALNMPNYHSPHFTSHFPFPFPPPPPSTAPLQLHLRWMGGCDGRMAGSISDWKCRIQYKTRPQHLSVFQWMVIAVVGQVASYNDTHRQSVNPLSLFIGQSWSRGHPFNLSALLVHCWI